MSLTGTCWKCGKPLEPPDPLKGRKATCPSCGAPRTVEGTFTLQAENREGVVREESSLPENPRTDQRQSRIWTKVVGDREQVRYSFSIGARYRRVKVLVLAIVGVLFVVASALAGLVIFASREGRIGLPAYALFFSLALLIPSLFYYGFYVKAARAYALTDERVLARKGWLSTNTVSVDYHKITDVAVSEDLLERLFTTNTGTVSVNTAGGPGVELTLGIWGLAGGRTSGRIVLEHVDQPYEVQRILRSLAMRAEELGPAEKPEER